MAIPPCRRKMQKKRQTPTPDSLCSVCFCRDAISICCDTIETPKDKTSTGNGFIDRCWVYRKFVVATRKRFLQPEVNTTTEVDLPNEIEEIALSVYAHA